MFNSRTLIEQSHTVEMSILCGVSSYSEAKQALLWGAEALKFYPGTIIKPKDLKNILTELKSDGLLLSSNVTDIIVAGGVLDTDYEAYIKAGATNFAMGFDCKKMTPRQIKLILKDLNKLYLSLL